MLTADGIIAEFNPLHNGHRYLIRRARKDTKANVIVVVMSGNWVQRGIPAIVDKKQRTKMALVAGADLIIELPAQFAVQPADLFANQAIALIKQLHCHWLTFGCEHPTFNFDQLAKIKIKSNHQVFRDYRATYATLIRRNFYQQTGMKITQPNDLLALNYARAKQKLRASFKLDPVGRLSRHQEINGNREQPFVSSSTIRYQLFHGDSIKSIQHWMPTSSLTFMSRPWLKWQSFWPWLRYRLVESSLGDLRSIYEMREGLEHRFKVGAVRFSDFNHFLQFIKTKRYTYSTLLRLCFYILIHLTKTDMQVAKKHPYLRILGFDQVGRKFLNQIKKQVTIPIITNVTKDALHNYLRWDFRAGMLFQMLIHHYEDLYQHPVIK